MQYRRDVDGLRAVAVGLVILFHCGFPAWSGGFVGVDVFFVISGFLITQLIAENVAQGRFNLGEFWMRRVRRLFVPVYVLMAVCLVAFGFIHPPHYYQDLAESALAQLVFVSNFLFFFENDYFDTASHVKPLLHTWSLSVEEQFYVLYPLLVLLCLRVWKRLKMWPIAAITAGSFALSVLAAESSPSGTFFLLPARAWELGVGCLLALLMRRRAATEGAPFLPGWLVESVALAGLAGILAASLAFTAETPFPSWNAALPVLGAAAVIWAGCLRSTLVTRLLGLSPLVFVGLMSYSLYLWHWPAIVAHRALRTDLPSAWANLAAVLVGAVLAWLSYRYIETPVRKRRELFTNNRLLAVTAASIAGIGAAGVAIAAAHGLPSRYEVAYDPPTVSPRVADCFNRFDGEKAIFCRLGPAKDVPDFVAIGDSHNRALLPALEALAKEHGLAGLFASTSGCLPLRGVAMPRDVRGTQRCRNIVNQAYDMVGPGPGQAPRLILTARWGYYTGRASSDGSFKAVTFGGSRGTDPESSRLAFRAAWLESMSELQAKGARVYVIQQPPHQYFYPADAAWRAAILGLERDAVAVTTAQHRSEQAVANAILTSLPYPHVIKLDSVFCGAARCAMFEGRQSLYFDDDHLSVAGARKVVPALAASLLKARAPE